MVDMEKVKIMFAILHPDLVDNNKFSVKYTDDASYADDFIVSVWKDGNCCWGYTLTELMFGYMTKDW